MAVEIPMSQNDPQTFPQVPSGLQFQNAALQVHSTGIMAHHIPRSNICQYGIDPQIVYCVNCQQVVQTYVKLSILSTYVFSYVTQMFYCLAGIPSCFLMTGYCIACNDPHRRIQQKHYCPICKALLGRSHMPMTDELPKN